MVVTEEAFPSELYAAKLDKTPNPFNIPASAPREMVLLERLGCTSPEIQNPDEIATEVSINIM